MIIVQPDNWIIITGRWNDQPFAFCSVKDWLEGIFEYSLNKKEKIK